MTVALNLEDAQGQLELAGPTHTSMRPERKLSDAFWIFTYKVDLCPKKDFHDWEKCAYAHPGERARRRHPSKYQAVQCPEARAKKVCPRGMDCPCTHHLFEYWLHPDRYLTCLCELGPSCNRPICFFAHTEDELRPLPPGLSVAAPPPAPALSNKQQHRRGHAAPHGSSDAPLNSLVPDLVASFHQGLAFSSGQTSPTAACDAAGPGLDPSIAKPSSSGNADSAAGSGVQQLIEQMAAAGPTTVTSSSSAFAALDELAAGFAGSQLTPLSNAANAAAAAGAQSSPLAVVLMAPNRADVARSDGGLNPGSPSLPLAAGQVLLRPQPQQQYLSRPDWQGPYLAVAPNAAVGGGVLPGMQPSVQVLQSQLQQLQQQQQGLLHQGSGASTSCSSPLGLVSNSPIGFVTGTPSTAAASPKSMTSGLDVFDMQHHGLGGGPRVMTPNISPGRLSPGILSQSQRYIIPQPGAAAGYAMLNVPMVNPQQMVPLQVYDEPPPEHLSFSLWSDGTPCPYPGAPGAPPNQQLILQSHSNNQPLLVQQQQRQQQQQLLLLQQRQQLLQQQQQILEQHYQLQQVQQAVPAAGSTPMMVPPQGAFSSVQPYPVNHAMQHPASQIPGAAMRLNNPHHLNAAASPAINQPVGSSSGFAGFQALDMLQQQQQTQQVVMMPQIQQQLQQP